MNKYKRVLIKLSGEALAGDKGYGYDYDFLNDITKELVTLHQSGVQIALVVGGGIGNMIDRLTLKYVVDMIDCRFIDFYVFNFADSCVCVGAGMVILGFLLSIIKEHKEKSRKEAEKDISDENMGG